MAFPKGFIKNIKLSKTKVGFPRRQELLDNITNDGTFLPRGVGTEDMDREFLDFIKDDLEITIGGQRVPVIFLTTQRWNEFSKTWQHSDKYKNIKLPFITVVREPDVQFGTAQDNNWNVAQANNHYIHLKVATFEGGRKGVDLYKIPQPTAMDIKYDVRLFCNRMKDVNLFNTLIQKKFNARQHYLFVNGHPMPVILNDIGDESQVEDFEQRRFYIQLFNMQLLGYLLSEEDYEVVPTVSRLRITEEIMVTTIKPTITFDKVKEVETICLYFFIKKKVRSQFKFTVEFDSHYTRIDTDNLSSVSFLVNNISKTLPFDVRSGDKITVNFVKETNNEASFNLNGILL